MERAEPGLRRTLLVSLLVPLLALLALDTAISWWTSRHVADQAYDRGLHEIAREAALHVHAGGQGPRLDLTEAAERALLVDQDDELALRVWTASGVPLGGDADLRPPPRLPPRTGAPLFYADRLHGEPVRVAVSWQPYAGSGGDQVLVQVAETLNKRKRLAWEFVGGIVAAQLALIGMACAAVYSVS